jgi:hypothetical protein
VIGVVSQPGQRDVVEEFFELFKTPWEFYRPDGNYSVVLLTAGAAPADVQAPLVVCSGSSRWIRDHECCIEAGARVAGVVASCQTTTLPLYGTAACFKTSADQETLLTSPAGPLAIRVQSGNGVVVRLGYDFFEEVRTLLECAQPAELAATPTLDTHVAVLRTWILAAGITLIEVPPVSPGHPFAVSLTHDIDFIGIRRHWLDHSMWGFLYRTSLGGLRDFVTRRIGFGRLVRMWLAATSLPFVYLGWLKDFWQPFEWYLRAESGLPATYYLIPFKGRPGERVTSRHASRRASPYGAEDVADWASRLEAEGCEVGVHAIDGWHSAEKGREERARIGQVAGRDDLGVRTHWLLQDGHSPEVLEQGGYTYDSTAGYNETIGYRNGTGQVFRPLGCRTLLELPLHIQDGALFYRQQLHLSEPDAHLRCGTLIEHARQHGGVLTVLWHDRSHGPERFWGDFYVQLLDRLKREQAWFGSARQIVEWFRRRRGVRFVRRDTTDRTAISVECGSGPVSPPLTVRIHRPDAERRGLQSSTRDITWDGASRLNLDISAADIPPQQMYA